MSDRLSDYAFEFPDELIALTPAEKRDESRLLVLNRKNQSVSHKQFSDIVDAFEPGDVLVLNNTKVFPCRLVTTRATGGRQEILLAKCLTAEPGKETWQVLLNQSKKVKQGDVFEFPGLTVTLTNSPGEDREALFEFEGSLFAILNDIAKMPLPPYIKRDADDSDKSRYQTVYAREQGSVAAPTAGLHFTPKVLQQLFAKGVEMHHATLHVGLGTFLPVKTDDIREHKMHEERYSVSENTWKALKQAKAEGRRITAVGTTSVRVLESVAATEQLQGVTDIFIHPPYEFKMVDRMLTNFHQPESTLMMLVSAFAGREFILSSYAEAIKEKYRLFSYGDAMLIE